MPAPGSTTPSERSRAARRPRRVSGRSTTIASPAPGRWRGSLISFAHQAMKPPRGASSPRSSVATSHTTTSNGSSPSTAPRIRSGADAVSVAIRRAPQLRSICPTVSMTWSSSLTTRAPRSAMRARSASSAGSVRAPRGGSSSSSAVRTMPPSAPDAAWMPPPIAAASWRLMARPRPVPPRVSTAGAGEPCDDGRNGSKSPARSALSSCGPSSVTSMVRRVRRPSDVEAMRRSTEPSAVTDSARATRFVTIWASRSASPRRRVGTSGSTSTITVLPRCAASAARCTQTSSHRSRTSRSAACSRSCPASTAERSSTSSSRRISDRPESDAACSSSRCASERSVPRARSVASRVACRGARTSWETVARNIDLAADARIASPRAACRASRVR